MSGGTFDFQAAQAAVEKELWMSEDPLAEIERRFPDASALELVRLSQIADEVNAQEFGYEAPAQVSHLTKSEMQAVRGARALVEFCDGLEQGGMEDYARRCRAVARDLLDLAGQLNAERSVRRSVAGQRDAALAILEKQAGKRARA